MLVGLAIASLKEEATIKSDTHLDYRVRPSLKKNINHIHSIS